MGFIIDANIVKGVYEEELFGSHDLSASPGEMLRRLVASGERICIDDGNIMLAEWENCVDRDWYENWFVTLSSESNLAALPPANCRALVKRLRIDYGFPLSRDCTVLAVAVADTGHDGSSCLLTEDLDFFDPKAKGQTGVRSRLLDGRKPAAVAIFLRRKHNIVVESMCLFARH